MPNRFLRAGLLALVALLVVGAPSAAAQQEAGEPEPTRSTKSASTSSASVVKRAQRKLGVRADGVLGPQTRRAIKRFQRRRGLKADGVLRTRTLRALGIRTSRRRAARPRSTPSRATLEQIAQCESGGNPKAISPDGRYRGKYQFSRATWESVGGTGDPAEAPEAEQDRLAAVLYERQGPSAWPNCAR